MDSQSVVDVPFCLSVQNRLLFDLLGESETALDGVKEMRVWLSFVSCSVLVGIELSLLLCWVGLVKHFIRSTVGWIYLG